MRLWGIQQNHDTDMKVILLMFLENSSLINVWNWFFFFYLRPMCKKHSLSFNYGFENYGIVQWRQKLGIESNNKYPKSLLVVVKEFIIPLSSKSFAQWEKVNACAKEKRVESMIQSGISKKKKTTHTNTQEKKVEMFLRSQTLCRNEFQPIFSLLTSILATI